MQGWLLWSFFLAPSKGHRTPRLPCSSRARGSEQRHCRDAKGFPLTSHFRRSAAMGAHAVLCRAPWMQPELPEYAHTCAREALKSPPWLSCRALAPHSFLRHVVGLGRRSSLFLEPFPRPREQQLRRGPRGLFGWQISPNEQQSPFPRCSPRALLPTGDGAAALPPLPPPRPSTAAFNALCQSFS